MQIDIRSNVGDVMKGMHEIHVRHIPFAMLYAATLTAKDVQAEEKLVMERVFDRPTPYTLNALWTKPATKNSPVAVVEFKEGFNGTPAKRFLNPEIHGGPRSQKGHERNLAGRMGGYSYFAPGRAMPLNSYGNMAGGTIKKILSQLGASTNADANASGSKRSKAKRKSQAFFMLKGKGLVMERKGKALAVALVGIRSPSYAKRFPFYETGQRVVVERAGSNFITAFERAIATSNRNGKW